MKYLIGGGNPCWRKLRGLVDEKQKTSLWGGKNGKKKQSPIELLGETGQIKKPGGGGGGGGTTIDLGALGFY